ncbi:hypothetical protein AAVH_13118 [Aphelenchoides avenae]|nr:hypothetical protein AAVH_13118 [Aphelenchus avenae]
MLPITPSVEADTRFRVGLDQLYRAEATTESQRLKRQAERLDDINIDVKAVDNSHHGAGGSGGEEAERLKREAPLNAITIEVNATDNSKHGDGRGQKSGGHQPSVTVEQPVPEAPAGDEAERLKRQAPLNAINIGVNATDSSKHGGGRKGGHPVPRGPGPVKPSKPTGDAGSEEGPGGSSKTEGPDGHNGAGHDGACNGSNNNNNNNNGNSNNNNNNNNNCKGGNNNNNNNNNNRLKRQVLIRLDDINVKVDAVDNSRHGAGAGERGGQEEPESEDAGRLARRG